MTGLRSAIGRIASKHVRVVSKALGGSRDRKEPSVREPMMNTDDNASEPEDMDTNGMGCFETKSKSLFLWRVFKNSNETPVNFNILYLRSACNF